MRAFKSHQCGLSSNPSSDIFCELSTPKSFSPGISFFPSPQKSRLFSNSNEFVAESGTRRTTLWRSLTAKSSLLIYFLFLITMERAPGKGRCFSKTRHTLKTSWNILLIKFSSGCFKASSYEPG